MFPSLSYHNTAATQLILWRQGWFKCHSATKNKQTEPLRNCKLLPPDLWDSVVMDTKEILEVPPKDHVFP